ncbi:hypothetical protein OSB04_016237 [Centaurea solstitialis]|uniref:SWIM-type domain-containing protein n=1 Tax=Centaurea solstitialis TaxID=347529 RepID=A0AA38TIQ4_9ASTR|nr:hypothetical protein OSB04_016237 [Centaurea solstitialis]
MAGKGKGEKYLPPCKITGDNCKYGDGEIDIEDLFDVFNAYGRRTVESEVNTTPEQEVVIHGPTRPSRIHRHRGSSSGAGTVDEPPKATEFPAIVEPLRLRNLPLRQVLLSLSNLNLLLRQVLMMRQRDLSEIRYASILFAINKSLYRFRFEYDSIFLDLETNLIEDIDANGYLVNHEDSENELQSEDNIDVNVDFNEDDFNGENIMGKIFDNLDDVYTFYNCYAFLHGFDIRIRVSKMKDGKWVVDQFNDIHNHELTTTPTKVMKHHSHEKFYRSVECKYLMVKLGQSELRPSQIKKAVNTMKSPFEADVTSKQCADILFEQRKQYKGKEFYGLIKHFQDKASVDMNQYFVVDLFEDGSPRNIFWADGRSRDSYIKFGDVVVFDVTYMTNKFKMPFAPFIGVNHHDQSILFGGALLENEKEETFEWLFENFLKCMFNKHPRAIITYQDKAMGNAIKKVFPNTRHRYCAWHIKKHELEHLWPFKAHYSDFEEIYRKWIKSDTIENFETQWEVLRDKYNFEGSCWMMEMYNQRKFWVKAFLKDVFLAGMTTSGRSESIHSFFDGYVNSNTMLNEFVIQYDKAVECRRAAEEDEDFKSMNSRPILLSVHPIFSKVGTCYTRKMFELFKREWDETTNNLTHETLSKSTEESTYKVGQLNVEHNFWRIVKFRFLNEVEVTCSCANFETYGIMCKHALYVMKKKHVEILPNHYILPRWTVDARYKVGNTRLEEMDGESEVSALNLWCVHVNCTKAIEQAKDSPDEINKVNALLVKFLAEQMDRKKEMVVENPHEDASSRTSQVDMMPQISIRDPVVHTKTNGRPKNATRIKSSLEVKKKKTCSYCKGFGHYINGCPKKKVIVITRFLY